MSLAFLTVPRIAVAAAVVLIGLLIWGIRNRLVWRMLSVLGIGAGTGLLVWGILIASMSEEPPFGTPAAIIALGAGGLAGSIALLAVSFFGGARAVGQKS